MINSKGTESKYTVKIPIFGAGIVGDELGAPCHAETQIRYEVVGVGSTNQLVVEGRISNSPNWYSIYTIIGATTGVVDISTYDHLRYNVTVSDGTGGIYSSGFMFNLSSVIKNESGIELGINPDGSLDVVDGLKSGGVYGVVNMPLANIAYEAKIGGSALAGRKSILLTILTANLYWGTDSSVTVATGTPLANGQQVSMTLDPSGGFRMFLVGSAINGLFRLIEIP